MLLTSFRPPPPISSSKPPLACATDTQNRDGFDDMQTLSLITEQVCLKRRAPFSSKASFQDLKNVGISKIGHIRRMLYELREYRRAQRTKQDPHSTSPAPITADSLKRPAPEELAVKKRLVFEDEENGDKGEKRGADDKAKKEKEKEKDKEKSKRKRKKEQKENQKQARGVTFQGSSSDGGTGGEEETTVVLVDFSRKQLSQVPAEVWSRTDGNLLRFPLTCFMD